MNQFEDFYKNKRVLVTGHTGFKGSWLALWLSELGANVIGVALPPESQPNHWDLLNLTIESCFADIRCYVDIARILREKEPDLVFHLAAQPLVRRSYDDPLLTWTTNVMGTANVLEACRFIPSVKGIVVVTTDKCYQNKEWIWPYREVDPLGGHDPYSASKACVELLADSYRKSYFTNQHNTLLATARAGNVIGGGDWSEDRLIPDLVRAITHKQSLQIRFPQATRPWQHVLDSLHGYLLLGTKLLNGESNFADAWNFGPKSEGHFSVLEVLKTIKTHWEIVDWNFSDNEGEKHETGFLSLDSSKAHHKLLWQPVWDIEVALAKTAEWYKVFFEKKQILSKDHLAEYIISANEIYHKSQS